MIQKLIKKYLELIVYGINLIEWYFNSNIIDLYLNKYNIVKQKYLNYSLSLQLVRDYQNYQIKIHTDSSSRQITSLIYFPSPESDKNDGTIFFTNLIKNQKVKDSKEKFDFNDGFEEIKKFEYLPNTSIDFQVSKNSWYGVYPTKSKQRDSLQISILANKKDK